VTPITSHGPLGADFAPDMLPASISARARGGLRRLARRLETLRLPVVEVETSLGACALFVDRGQETRAAVVPAELAELPGSLLESTLCALRGLAPRRRVALLAWGAIPDRAARKRLRAAGVTLALYEPLDAAVLHFQVNRALAPCHAPPRRATRAPLAGSLAVRWRLRTRPLRAYSVSSQGAFLLTDAALRPGRRLSVCVPAGLLSPRAQGRVVMVNPPGGGSHPELPPGVAVAFENLDGPSAAVIDRLVGERLAELGV
jgi:hypothetical protein